MDKMVSGMLDPGGDRSFIFCKNVQEMKQEEKSGRKYFHALN